MLRRQASVLSKTFKVPISTQHLNVHDGRRQGFKGPPQEVELSHDEVLKAFKTSFEIRRLENECVGLYQGRKIRGFLHLYDGQESVCTGMQAALTDTDAIITAYRDHGWHLMRGGTTRDALAEMMGKFEGCAKGKGGSMHLYNPKGGFYGGNGIVGAQCPIGAGIAFKFAYKNSKAPEGVVITLYGDGAANQGQLYEGFNMAALWNLPVIFTCENNLYGMGTSVKRASANEEFHSRCEYIPGIRADGNDYATVKAVTKYSKEWCMAGNGPVVLEMKTYRFMNHSISDKGLYRSSTEVDEYRRKDPIVKLKELLIEHKIMAESEINKLEDKIMEDVSNLVEEVKKLPPPPFRELGTDTFVEKVVVRGIDIRKPIVPE